MSAATGTITLAEAVRALGAQKTGRDYRAACPAHGGDGPNLSLREGSRSELVVYCHSRGCDAAAILAAIRERVHGSGASPVRSTWGGALREVVAEYSYENAAGRLIGQVWRYEETTGGSGRRLSVPATRTAARRTRTTPAPRCTRPRTTCPPSGPRFGALRPSRGQ